MLFAIFLKSLNVSMHHLMHHLILKIMNQFRCYILSDENFSCHLLLQDGKDGHGLKCQLFQVLMLCMQKLLWSVLPGEI